MKPSPDLVFGEGFCYTQDMWKSLSRRELQLLGECLHHAAMACERRELYTIESEMWNIWQEVRLTQL